MRAANKILFQNADMSGNLTSVPISLFNIFGYCIQLEFTGAPVGATTIMVSNDPSDQGGAIVPAPTNFTLLANSSLAISAAGDLMYNVNECNYNWFKVLYTRTSGTGSLNGRFNLKGF